MRIGYLVQQFPPEVGAGPARVAEMASRWVQAGHEVTVITAMPNRPQGRIHQEYRGRLFDRDTWNGIEVLRSWVYARPDMGFAGTLLNNLTFMGTGAVHGLLRSGALDVLIASSPPFFVHMAGALQAGVRRTPLVLELRDLWPDYLVDMGKLRNGLARSALFRLERSLLARADQVVVVTDSFKRRVVEKGVAADRIHVIPNGVDLERYRPLAAADRADTGDARDEFVVGYLGNFGAGQDLSVIVEAAERVAAEDPSIRFRLVGDGPDRTNVEARASDSAARVTIEPPIRKEETPEFYADCDLCLVPLAAIPVFQETVPSKIFEIMASGRPVLGCFSGEGAAIVEASGGGRVAPPGDAHAIAREILELRRMTPEARRRLGEKGRTYVRQHYARTDLADRYLDMLGEVVGEGGDGGGSRD